MSSVTCYLTVTCHLAKANGKEDMYDIGNHN